MRSEGSQSRLTKVLSSMTLSRIGDVCLGMLSMGRSPLLNDLRDRHFAIPYFACRHLWPFSLSGEPLRCMLAHRALIHITQLLDGVNWTARVAQEAAINKPQPGRIRHGDASSISWSIDTGPLSTNDSRNNGFSGQTCPFLMKGLDADKSRIRYP